VDQLPPSCSGYRETADALPTADARALPQKFSLQTARLFPAQPYCRPSCIRCSVPLRYASTVTHGAEFARIFSARHSASPAPETAFGLNVGFLFVYQSHTMLQVPSHELRSRGAGKRVLSRSFAGLQKAAAEVATVEEVRNHHALPNYNNFCVDPVRSRYYADRCGLVWPARGNSVVKVHPRVMDCPTTAGFAARTRGGSRDTPLGSSGEFGRDKKRIRNSPTC
jgi:hypothetical protein